MDVAAFSLNSSEAQKKMQFNITNIILVANEFDNGQKLSQFLLKTHGDKKRQCCLPSCALRVTSGSEGLASAYSSGHT